MQKRGIPFFVLGVVFLAVGVQQRPLLALGVVFLVLGFALGRRSRPDGPAE